MEGIKHLQIAEQVIHPGHCLLSFLRFGGVPAVLEHVCVDEDSIGHKVPRDGDILLLAP